ncbi:DUF2070 family protein [Halorutilales archaeon Cl-col2-1]
MSLGYGHASRLTRYLFRTPRWYLSLSFALVAGSITGLGGFGDGLVAAVMGFLFIGVPTVGAALATTPIDRYFGGNMTWNRSAFLAVLCEGVTVVLISVAAVFQKYLGFESFVYDALIASLALIFGLRFLVLMAVSRDSALRTLVPASLQTGFAAVILYFYTGLPLSGDYFTNLVITSGLYVMGSYVLVRLIDHPMRTSIGVSGLELLRGFLGYLTENTRELEEVFERMGESVRVPVTVLVFRRKKTETDEPDSEGDDLNQNQSRSREKARFVLPMVHPGIMGEIGGGNLPFRLAETSDSLCFVPHATADHDFNPVSQREVEKLRAAADRAVESVEYNSEATRSRRLDCGDSHMIGQRFGDGVFLATTCSPKSCDDIRFSVGLSAISESHASGAEETMLVDAHNCYAANSGTIVSPGSERSYNIMDCSADLSEALVSDDTYPLRLGTAQSPTRWEIEDGMGPLGIRVAVLEAGDQTTAYALVDGNNMVPMLRDEIVDVITDDAGVDNAEVMTTDTHVVNRVESHNRIGEHIPHGELKTIIRSLVTDAVNDLEEVEAGMASNETEVIVFGNDRIERLASTTNAVASMGTALAVVATFAALMLSALVFFLN